MRVIIDRRRCIGAGTFIVLAPSAFGWRQGDFQKPENSTLGIISFERVRALIDFLVSDGRLDADVAADILERLDSAETLWANGRTTQAQAVLRSVVRQLEAAGGSGVLPEVAPALAAEFELLIDHLENPNG